MKKVYILLLAISALGVKSQTQQELINKINQVIIWIPYVFEGHVSNVSVFAGDNKANPLPHSSATWDGDFGVFDTNGEVFGYTKAEVYVCKVYKGDIVPGQVFEVITRSFQIQNLYLQKVGPDTIVRFIFVSAMHNNDGRFKMFVPHNTYPLKKMFFADRIDAIESENYVDQNHYSNFNFILEVTMNTFVDIEQADGSAERTYAYAAIHPYVFATPSELETFLEQIVTINATPDDYCQLAKSTGLKENGLSGFNIYPNPAADVIIISVNKTTTVIITDIVGRVVYSQRITTNTTLTDNLPSGVYFVKAISGNDTQVTKIIKK